MRQNETYERPPPHPLLLVSQRQNQQKKGLLVEVQRLTERVKSLTDRNAQLEELLNLTLDGWMRSNPDHRRFS